MSIQRTVLLTGASGFLGSHILGGLINEKYRVICLKRANSNIWRCTEYKNEVQWIDYRELNANELEKLNIDIIIHCAWNGVLNDLRDNWVVQIDNVWSILELLNIARLNAVDKFICLGSQAEYGTINSLVTENSKTEPTNAYGKTKLACLEILKLFCETNQINWIWLRIFSIFGEKEGMDWLISSVIQSMSTSREYNCTLGEQKYAYLYVADFVKIIIKIVNNEIESGVYNVSSNQLRTIRSIITEIRDLIDPTVLLNFGAIPYRINQPMLLDGATDKLQNQIGDLELTPFHDALMNCIKYHNRKNEGFQISS